MTNNPFIPYSDHRKLGALLTGSHCPLMERVSGLLVSLFDREIPEGYEDETGFHYAVQAVTSEDRVPPGEPVWQGEHI